MGWRLAGDGQELPADGYDGTVWAWDLASEDGLERRRILVKISGTAMATRDVHFRVDHARQSKGQTEVARVLEWEEPPKEIEFFSTSATPKITGGDPGQEVAEIAQITDWFEARGILLVFTGRALGGPRGNILHQVNTANLIDRAADKLVERFEAPSRLAAAREAKQWWLDHHGPQGQTISVDPASAHAGGELELTTPEVEPPDFPNEQLERVKKHRLHLVYTGPTVGDAESGWMIEVYDDADQLCGIAVGKTAEDALTTVLEDLLPPEDAE